MTLQFFTFMGISFFIWIFTMMNDHHDVRGGGWVAAGGLVGLIAATVEVYLHH